MIVPCIRKQNDWSTVGVSGLNNLLINLMIMKSWFSREPFEWEQSKCICGFITYTCKWGNDVLDMLPGITIFQRLVFMLFFTTAYDNIISQNYNAIIHMYRILIYLPRNTMNCTHREFILKDQIHNSHNLPISYNAPFATEMCTFLGPVSLTVFPSHGW